MSLTRRQFLKASGVAFCAGGLSNISYAAAPLNKLPIPPLIESRGGRPLFLSMQTAHWAFSHDKSALVWGFNGRYLGPTVRVYSGENVKLSFANHLYEPIGLTISGLQVPGSIINSPARIIRPGSSWSPVLPIRQPSSTCWYHACTPGHTAPHVYNGLAGMWIIEDPNGTVQGLPNQYGVNDFPVILQDKKFSFAGMPEYKPPYKNGFLGDTLLTNGVQEPVLEVGKTWIRLRLLNASNARRYTLALSHHQPMYLIASDRGLLSSPIELDVISIAPGERKEILIDMSSVNELSLLTGVRRGFIERVRGFFELSNELSTAKVLTLQSSGLASILRSDLPAVFNVKESTSYTAQKSRQFILKKEGTINGRGWQANRIDVRASASTQERWLVSADFPQPFHIQGAQFRVISVDNKLPQPEDSGWKDTVWVDRPVELLVRFNKTSSDSDPFFFSSQNFELADAGAVGQLVVS